MPGFGDDGWWRGGFGLQGLATVCMLIAAYRRGAAIWWMYIILFAQPLGPWAYLLVELLPGLFRRSGTPFRPRATGGGGWFGGGPSLAELQHRAERSPTVANRLALGERLLEKGRPAEAVPHAEAALAPDPNYGPAAYLLARSKLQLGDAAAAAELMGQLVDRDPRWSNYRAWATLIAARDALGDAPGALAAARKLERLDPNWERRCDLARRLIAADEAPAAATLLEAALRDAEFQPLGRRWGDWQWRQKAQRLLAQARAAGD